MEIVQGLPSEASTAGDLARELLRAIGPAYQGPDGSNHAADALALGGALAGARSQTLAALAEAFATEATQMLSELEAEYGLPVRTDLSTADRQTRLVAKIRAARAGSPQDILRAVHAYDPTATLVENTPATVPREADFASPPWPGAARGVFQVAVVITAAVWNDPTQLAAIRALVEQMKPAHCGAAVVTNAVARFDDPASLFDACAYGE